MMIAVKFVNFPKPGAKYGQLFLPDNTCLMCPPDLLGHFRAGWQGEVPTKDQVWFRGSPDEKTVTIVAGPPGGQYGAVQQPYGQAAPGANVSRETSVRSNTGFQPRVYEGGRSQGRQWNQQPKDERQIFITGVVGRAMGSGKFAATEIPVLARCAAEAWETVVSPVIQGNTLQGAVQPIGTGGFPQGAASQYLPPQYNSPPEPEMGDPGPGEPM